jgi:hypothetical protein
MDKIPGELERFQVDIFWFGLERHVDMDKLEE